MKYRRHLFLYNDSIRKGCFFMGKHYTVHKINADTFVLEEKSWMGQALCYLVCGEKKALLIDTGTGCQGLADTVRELTDLTVTVANTHAHIDHIGGNHEFGEIWFHEKDREIFQKHVNPEYTFGLLEKELPPLLRAPLKALTRKRLSISTKGNYHYFGDDAVFELGDREIEVIPTPGHTPGGVCFLDRRERMLFTGDTLCEWGVLLHFPGEGCPAEVYRDSLLRLKALEGAYDTIWPGHHGFPVEKSYLDEYLACASQIVEKTAVYGETKGRRCAKYKRILITVPKEDAYDDRQLVER